MNLISAEKYPNTRLYKSLRHCEIQDLAKTFPLKISDTIAEQLESVEETASNASDGHETTGDQDPPPISDVSTDNFLVTSLLAADTMSVKFTGQQFGNLIDVLQLQSVTVKTISPNDLLNF